MAEFTWTYDMQGGVFKSRAASEKIRTAAISKTNMLQFARPETGYGKGKGESISILRVGNLAVPTSGRLNELEKMPEDQLTLSSTVITVAEFGRSVPYTELAADLATFNLENPIQKALMNQMKLVLDSAAADAFKAAPIKYVPTGAASATITTNGTAGAQATSNLNVFHVEQIRDYMFNTLLAPMYGDGEEYIAFVSTKAKRGIMNDPKWEDWHKYTNAQDKYNSELGKLEQFRFIEIQNSSALSQSLGLNGVLGEAVFFGDDAVAMAIAQDPELRAKPGDDYGRSRGIAWYGILNFGLVWGSSANPGESRVVHVTST
jgi:N4-gp56 family major capsid protein